MELLFSTDVVSIATLVVRDAFHCLGSFRVGQFHSVYDPLPEVAAMEYVT